MIEIDEENYIIYSDGRRVWSKRRNRFIGTVNKKSGYIYCDYMKKKYPMQRLVWMKFVGPIPEGMDIDHKNSIRGDNRLENLQVLTRSENNAKQGKQINNTSGFIGICIDKRDGIWQAGLQINGKRKSIGRFKTAVQAAMARDVYIIENNLKYYTLNFS